MLKYGIKPAGSLIDNKKEKKMKEFMNEHPIMTFLIVSTICGAVVSCVRMIINPEAAKTSTIPVIVKAVKEEKKGA